MSATELDCLSPAELEQLGQHCLREHLAAQARVAHQKHAPLTAANLDALLQDPDCVRYPTRLVFEFGAMASHQFAQPGLDWRHAGQNGRVLHLRPMLRDRPDLVVLAVAYMIASLNYGDIVTDEHCLLYGATLLGMMEEEFYHAICDLAEAVGAETLWPHAAASSPSRASCTHDG